MKGLKMFSVNVIDGASTVPLAVLMMADNSAPKKHHLREYRGVFEDEVGQDVLRVVCQQGFDRRRVNQRGGAGQKNRHEGKQKIQRTTEDGTGDGRGFDLADITRWNTSCCGIEPSIMVTQAAMKASTSRVCSAGQNSNLPAAWV